MNDTDDDEIDEETAGTDTFSVLASDVTIPLEDVTVNPPTGTWGGGNFTFNVTVNTTGINNVTVFLWTRLGTSGSWSLLECPRSSHPMRLDSVVDGRRASRTRY